MKKLLVLLPIFVFGLGQANAQLCGVPTGLASSNITSSSADLSWNTASGAVKYSLQYKVQGAGSWTTVSNLGTNSYQLTGLSDTTRYEFQVRSQCNGGVNSSYSSSAYFTTRAICAVPSSLSVTNLTSSSADLTWGAVTGGYLYSLQYALQGSGSWTTVSSITTNSYSLTGLSASTGYQFKVRSECGGGNNSSYSSASNFSTPAVCGVPTSLSAGNITSSSAELSWGAVSGASSYSLQHSLAGSSGWTTVSGLTTTSYTLTGLSASTTNNKFMVRAECGGANNSSYSSVSAFNTPAVCAVPTSLSAGSITTSSADLTWGSVSGASSYSLQYALQGSGSWTTVSGLTTNSYSLSSLSANTGYQFKVRAECGGANNSGYSSATNFSTLAICGVPSSLSAGGFTSSSAVLSWTVVSGASAYSLQYALQGSSSWTTVSSINTNSYSLTGLADSTAYQFKVRAECGGSNNSSYSSAYNFSTLSLGVCPIPYNLAVSKITDEAATISWDEVTGAVSYTLKYINKNGSDTIPVQNIHGTSYRLTGLFKEATYYVEVRCNCAGNNPSAYSAPISFTAKSFKLTAKAFYSGTESFVRWAPLDFESWKWGNEHGYRLKRMTLAEDGVELGISDQLASIVVLDSNLVAISEDDFEPLADSSDMAGLAAGLIYGDSLEVINYDSLTFSDVANLSKERDLRFGFGLFAADNSFEVAVAMGLGFLDVTAVEDNEYMYIIEMRDVPAEAQNGRTVTTMLASGTPTFPAPKNLKANTGDRETVVFWDKLDIDEYYTSYYVEKSSNGGSTFEQVNDLPLIFTSSLVEAPAIAEFHDSLATNGTTYIYRVRGKTPYDIYGPYSDTIHVIGKPAPLDAELVIASVSGDSVDYGDLEIKWTFPSDLQNDIAGFEVYRSEVIGGGFEKINSNTLSVTTREYIDEDPMPVNFYKVITYDLNGNELTTNALLGQPKDTIPPSAPTGASGTCDKNGKVVIHWLKNTEPDIMGYRVFMSNGLNGDYAQITGTWINDSIFIYYINLKTLSEKVYFAIKALDHRENTSGLSTPCEVARPDIIPPAPPTISNVTSEPKMIHFDWILSSSDDVVQYDFERKIQGGAKWEVLLTFTPTDNLINFTDSTASYKTWYNYRLLAKDEANLKSSSKIVKARPVDNGIRDSIENFAGGMAPYGGGGLDVDSIAVLLWNYDKDIDLEGFQIYRGIDTSDLRAYKFISYAEASEVAGNVSYLGLAFADFDLDFVNIPVQTNYTSSTTIVNSGGNPTSGSNVFPLNPNIANNPTSGVTLVYKVMAKFVDGGTSPLSKKVEVFVQQ